jgi:acetyl-CoA acetyltransferase
LTDIDVFEVNEAAQALAVCRELQLAADRTNPNGRDCGGFRLTAAQDGASRVPTLWVEARLLDGFKDNGVHES